MMGLVQIGDEVSWTDNAGNTHYGDIVAVTDDGTYADVYEHDIEDVVVIPTALLNHN